MGEKKKFRLRFHQKVLTHDLPNLKPSIKELLLHFINEKLVKRPFSYARPLRGGNDGYWKVRLGDYILGFKIMDDIILILSIIPFYKLYDKIFSSNSKEIH